ncbi:YIF1-domain-containing protein [Trametes versicolor FP-101664 SS1]|uniref:YIF1-domain-containing protein n=1 Tax=Trametes versicolor (strain FP-101664) TaxID=717944 RepID=UPI0004621994|nr:YIF1-domain-containing protein [Trametes versicolor FP-101664 SS1]EIW56111.1 YIF1-domain-containing protein [Trametes versicolor FP-101664 SS1]
MAYYNTNSHSPPPLQHPVPTHPAYIPEPPSTPMSPQGYQRYTSTPPSQPYAQQMPSQAPHPSHMAPPYGAAPVYHQPLGAPSQGHPSAMGPNGPVDFSAWGLDNATAAFGMQLGQSAVAAGSDYVQKNLGGFIPISNLKHHFNVSNSFVIRKLRLLLFPWRHRPWSRQVVRLENGQSEWAAPREDLNSPDLYIPLMAIVTYILLAALHSGLNARFHPEILGITASKALAVVLLDFLFVKSGCYLLNIPGGLSSQVLDVLAYDGYKFVGVIVTLIAGLLGVGRTLYLLIFLYTFLATAFFLLRSLRSMVLPDASATAAAVNPSQRSRRITFLFLVAVSQIVYMGVLVRV